MTEENKKLSGEVNETPEEAAELNEKDVGGVSGGGIYDMGVHTMDPGNPWVVLDDNTGDFLGFYGSKKQALQEAKAKGVSTVRYWSGKTVDKMQRAYKQHKKYENRLKKNVDFNNPYADHSKSLSEWLNEDISNKYKK